MRFVSTRGEAPPVDFETAVLQGYAPDGGLYVPERIPQVSRETLARWAGLGFADLAFEILSLFIEPAVIPPADLRRLIGESYGTFESPDICPVTRIAERTFVLELFHGPTLSFKDLAMGVIVNLADYFLRRRGTWQSLIVVTTGDTGPAAAQASAGKPTLECWVLYPDGMISDEQARQMTTLDAANIHAVRVAGCPNGGDDLDLLVAELSADTAVRNRLRLSSVNSINLCRVLAQIVHFFYGYFRVVESPDERIVMSVPSGGFGNLFGGSMARMMGLPVERFVCANNQNATLHRIIADGEFRPEDLRPSVSSAIDIMIPYNFWRYLYLVCGRDAARIRGWMEEFRCHGGFRLDQATRREIEARFLSASISDETTLSTICGVFERTGGYALDPHAAVAVAAAEQATDRIAADAKVLCFATAHPAKFPTVLRQALRLAGPLPTQLTHESIERARSRPERCLAFDYATMSSTVRQTMEAVTARRRG